MDYLVIKWLHIMSATILFGTGLGSVFYKYMADRGNNLAVIAATNKNLVLADWLFTTPTIFIQIITGFIMTSSFNITFIDYVFKNIWLLISIILFILTAFCWLIVVFLQIKMRNLAMDAVKNHNDLAIKYYRYNKAWLLLGIPAFISMIAIFYLMITKPMLL